MCDVGPCSLQTGFSLVLICLSRVPKKSLGPWRDGSLRFLSDFVQAWVCKSHSDQRLAKWGAGDFPPGLQYLLGFSSFFELQGTKRFANIPRKSSICSRRCFSV